jgi:hypothetical protein
MLQPYPQENFTVTFAHVPLGTRRGTALLQDGTCIASCETAQEA